jgi:hypothetical protein
MTTSNDVFKSQKKLRHAEVIRPPNALKQKVGSGDIPAEALKKAQDLLDNPNMDFKPIALNLIKQLSAATQMLKGQNSTDEKDIEMLLYPAMQLKTQGAMLKYPFVAEIGEVLVPFLETVTEVSEDVISVVEAHQTAFEYVLKTPPDQISKNNVKKITESLLDACERYYTKNNKTNKG